MTNGYAFWCTPCGASHPGECPPAAPVVVPAPPGLVPEVGSRWAIEFRKKATGQWEPSQHNAEVEVISVDLGTRKVTFRGNWGPTRTPRVRNLDHWTAEGEAYLNAWYGYDRVRCTKRLSAAPHMPGLGTRWRFRHRPATLIGFHPQPWTDDPESSVVNGYNSVDPDTVDMLADHRTVSYHVPSAAFDGKTWLLVLPKRDREYLMVPA